jgi:5'-methylthioadenosine phosphorylase
MFSTKAESHTYRKLGFDIIGMTNLQEAKLAREAEICYATVAMVTDYDCWHPDHDAVTGHQVMEYLARNIENVQKVIRGAVPSVPDGRDCKCGSALAHAIITEPKKIPAATKKKLAPIIGKYVR